MKKKVAIITYSKSPNYGAALQLYATYKILEILGYEPQVVNYRNEFEDSYTSINFLFKNAGIKEKVRWFFSGIIFRSIANSQYNFNDFYKELNYTDYIVSANEISKLNEIDIFCVGSDQVWNPEITNGFDDVFCLNTNINAKKISYASSMGSVDVRKYDDSVFINSLKAFDFISVREKAAMDYLIKRGIQNIKLVCDPTLLFNKKQWIEFMVEHSKVFMPSEKYVLVYALGGRFEECNDVAHKISKMIKAKVVLISLSNRKKNVDYLYNKVKPEDFIKLISQASFVVTNSFHGTCFSLIFEIPFYSVKFGTNPLRAQELLNRYGLSDRLLSSISDISEKRFDRSDIIDAQIMLKNDINESIEWLRRAVED